MGRQDIEQAIYSLLTEYNGRSLITFRRYPLKHSTDLNGNFRMDPYDAYELLEKYSERFGIDSKSINFQRYFPDDFSEAHKPLTVQLLIDPAEAGSWLDK